MFMSFNVSGARYLRGRIITHSPQIVKTPDIHKTLTGPSKIHPHPHKYSPGIDSDPQKSYNVPIHIRSTLMSVVYQQAQKQRYRITLDLQVLGDFDPHQLDWEKLFKLEPAERVEAYVEDLNCPLEW
jgi:hypothetical protein